MANNLQSNYQLKSIQPFRNSTKYLVDIVDISRGSGLTRQLNLLDTCIYLKPHKWFDIMSKDISRELERERNEA